MGTYTSPNKRQLKVYHLFRDKDRMTFPARAWRWWCETYTLEDMAEMFADGDNPNPAKIWQWVKDGIIPNPVNLGGGMYLWGINDFVARELPDEILNKITAYDKYVNEQIDLDYGVAGAGQSKLC